MSYEFKTTPLAHQRTWVEDFGPKPWGAIFFDMGTGKTKTTIDNAGLLFEAGRIDGAVIIAPKSVYREWIAQIAEHLPDRIPRRVLALARLPQTQAEKAAARPVMTPISGTLDFLLVPISQLRLTRNKMRQVVTGSLFPVVQYFTKHHRALMAIDESTLIKNIRAAQTKGAIALGQAAPFKRLLSGEPMPNGPIDLMAQFAFLSPTIIGCDNEILFNRRYAITKRARNPRAGETSKAGRKIPDHFETVVGWRNIADLKARIAPYTMRVRKEDCLDLPEKVYQRREVELTRDQRAAYESMAKKAIVELGSDLVTVQFKITQLLRLHQITCGYLPLDDGTLKPIHSNRIPELLAWLEETSGKVVLWGTYLHSIREIEAALGERYGAKTVATYTGALDADGRQDLRLRFNDPDSKLRFLVANKAAAYGVGLTGASVAGYYSNTDNLGDRLQSEDRTHRLGQKNTCVYVDFVAPGTIDETILRGHREKKHLSQLVIDTPIEDLIHGVW